MRTKFMMIAAGAAMTFAAPAYAQDSNNGRQNREQARSGSQGPDNANRRGIERSNENSVLNGSGSGQQDRMNRRRQGSQGGANANQRAGERADQNSAVREGMMVHDRNNKMIGRVKEVKRSSTGIVIAIVIVLNIQINGTTQITLPAGSFTIVAGVVIVATITAPSGS